MECPGVGGAFRALLSISSDLLASTIVLSPMFEGCRFCRRGGSTLDFQGFPSDFSSHLTSLKDSITSSRSRHKSRVISQSTDVYAQSRSRRNPRLIPKHSPCPHFSIFNLSQSAAISCNSVQCDKAVSPPPKFDKRCSLFSHLLADVAPQTAQKHISTLMSH